MKEMKRLENVLFGSLYDPIEFGKEDEEKVQDEAETGSAMYFVRDDKNSHGDGYPRRFSPFGEGMGIISYPISYSGKGRGNFFTQFLIRGGDGDEVESPSPTHFPIFIFIF